MTGLLVASGALVNAVILGGLARRLLGVPVGWPRTVLVGLATSTAVQGVVVFLGRVSGLATAPGTVPAPGVASVQYGLLVALTLAWAVAVGLGVLVVLEAFVPTGSLPAPVTWARGLPARWRRARRYTQVVAIATRHGLGPYLRGRGGGSPRARADAASGAAAGALRQALAEAGVTFVKLGQMLAGRPDVVGTAVAHELGRLQADAPPVPWQAVRPTVEAEVAVAARPGGEGLEHVFRLIDPHPLAAASVAQVHGAVLAGGESVVLKVQRPDAAAQVRADADILLRLSAWLERSTSWGRSLGVHDLARGFVASLAEELDYRIEAESMRALAAALVAAGGRIRVPQVHEHLSGRRLLVMERIDGVPLSRAASRLQLLPAERRRELAHDLLDAVLHQILISGVFHADLHQGNVLLTVEHRLVLLDMGSVGRLDATTRTGLGLLLHAVDRGDSLTATDALLDLVDRPDHQLDERDLEREIGQVIGRYAGEVPAGQGTEGMFLALMSLVVRHRLRVPPQVAAALRALGSLEATLAVLDPGIDLVATARRRGRALLGERYTPDAVRDRMEDQLAALLPVLQRLPRRIDQITGSLAGGRPGLQVRLLAHEDDRRFLRTLMMQLTSALLATACGLAGVILLATQTGPMMLPALPVHHVIGYTLLLFALVIGSRALVHVFRLGAREGG